MNAYHGPPMTLGNAAAARVRLIVWCLDCRHQVEPDPAEMAARYGAEMTVPDWRVPACASSMSARSVRTGRTVRPEWIAIRPNTDTAMMLALAHTLIAEDRHDAMSFARYCSGFDRVLPYLTGAATGRLSQLSRPSIRR
jgi:Molybdopterin oxidoreductase